MARTCTWSRDVGEGRRLPAARLGQGGLRRAAAVQLASLRSFGLVKREEIARVEGIPHPVPAEYPERASPRRDRDEPAWVRLGISAGAGSRQHHGGGHRSAVDGNADGSGAHAQHQVWRLAGETLQTLLQGLTVSDLIGSVES